MPAREPDVLSEAVRLHDDALERLDGGELEAAEAACRRSLALLESALGADAPDVANVSVTLASIREARGDHLEAESLHRRALKIAEATPELEELLVHCLREFAGWSRVRGRYDEAEDLYRRALAIRADVALLNGLAVVFKYTGRFDDGERLYRRALELADDDEQATIFHNLGGLEHARGRYAQAEPYARRAVELREAALGPDDLAVAADRAALAGILTGLDQDEEAEALLRDALDVFERAYGPVHYELAINLHNLAAIEARRGDIAAAGAHYRRALAIKETVLGATHPELATTLNNLALLVPDPAEAESLLRRALALLEAAVDPSHPNLAACRANLVDLLHERA